MQTLIRAKLRSIMLMAWSFKRDEPSREFGDCLKGAWKFIKNMSAFAKKAKWKRKRRISFGSLIVTPTEKALRRDPYAKDRARQASQISGRLGR